jgi:hypothetical protein
VLSLSNGAKLMKRVTLNWWQFVSVLTFSLIACSAEPSYVGRFVDPSGTAWVDIRAEGKIVNAMGTQMQYQVDSSDADGTTLMVSDESGWTARWRVTPDGKELHGASSPAVVVFRRR